MVADQLAGASLDSPWLSALNGATLKVTAAFRATEESATYRLTLEKGGWHIVISCRDGSESRRAKMRVDSDEVAYWGERLRAATVPAIPDEVHGCDGNDFILTFKNELSAVTYRYWNSPPRGFEPIVEFGDWLMSKEPAGW